MASLTPETGNLGSGRLCKQNLLLLHHFIIPNSNPFFFFHKFIISLSKRWKSFLSLISFLGSVQIYVIKCVILFHCRGSKEIT